MSTIVWRFINFKDRDGKSEWKRHVVPASLQRLLIADCIARGAAVEEILTITGREGEVPLRPQQLWFDPGGMCVKGAPETSVQLNGIKAECRCEDAAWAVMLLDGLARRSFGSVSYFKAHMNPWQCAVLTPAQYEQLRQLFRAELRDAEARATAFYAEHKLPSEVLREAQPRVPADVDLGAHKQDRFKPRVRGQS